MWNNGHLAPHVPHPGGGVPATTDEHIECRVESQIINGAKMSVVVPDHLVVLKIPALNLNGKNESELNKDDSYFTHLSILPAGEQIWLPVGDGETSDNGDVASEGDLELAAGQVPDLDHPVRRTCGEPLVSRLDCAATHLG